MTNGRWEVGGAFSVSVSIREFDTLMQSQSFQIPTFIDSCAVLIEMEKDTFWCVLYELLLVCTDIKIINGVL